MTYRNQDIKYSVLRLPEVQQQTGLSRSAIYQRISENKFPNSISLGSRARGWIDSDIQDWIKSRMDESRIGA